MGKLFASPLSVHLVEFAVPLWSVRASSLHTVYDKWECIQMQWSFQRTNLCGNRIHNKQSKGNGPWYFYTIHTFSAMHLTMLCGACYMVVIIQLWWVNSCTINISVYSYQWEMQLSLSTWLLEKKSERFLNVPSLHEYWCENDVLCVSTVGNM